MQQMNQATQEPVYEFKADPRRLCEKCSSEMHYCHTERYSARTERGKVIKGCAAKGRSHPAENVWICLWCDIAVPC